jgi:hypothetical protein
VSYVITPVILVTEQEKTSVLLVYLAEPWLTVSVLTVILLVRHVATAEKKIVLLVPLTNTCSLEYVHHV